MLRPSFIGPQPFLARKRARSTENRYHPIYVWVGIELELRDSSMQRRANRVGDFLLGPL